MSTEDFEEWIESLYSLLSKSLNGSEYQEKFYALKVLESIVELEYSKIPWITRNIRLVLEREKEMELIELAADTFGKAARLKSSMMVDSVQSLLQHSFEWLNLRNFSSRHQAALILLGVLAVNAPSIIYSNISDVFEILSKFIITLKDNTMRTIAVDSLRTCIRVLQRDQDSSYHQELYQFLYDSAIKGTESADTLFGSIEIMKELLRNSGRFLQNRDRYNQCLSIIQSLINTSNAIIRKSILSSIPLLASISPERFIPHVESFAKAITNSLKRDEFRVQSLKTFGETASIVPQQLEPWLEEIVESIYIFLTYQKKLQIKESLECVLMLFQAYENTFTPYFFRLLPAMLETGLSEQLISVFSFYEEKIESTDREIPIKVVELLSNILKERTFLHKVFNSNKRVNTIVSSNEIKLALKTLRSFKLDHWVLSEFLKNSIIKFLDDEDPEIRKEAILSSTHIIKTRGVSLKPNIINLVLSKLIKVSIVDPEIEIRKIVLQSFSYDLDLFLCQKVHIRLFLNLLNDPTFKIREESLKILCRLSTKNPGYILPPFRRTLMHFMDKLVYSHDSLEKEDNLRLLDILLSCSKSWISPYGHSVLKCLLSHLEHPDHKVASCSMRCIGTLSSVAPKEIEPEIYNILPKMISMFQDRSSSSKRMEALRSLGLMVQSTGEVIEPLVREPELLPILLNILGKERVKEVRNAATNTLGILGALDPFRQRKMKLKSSRDDSGEILRRKGTPDFYTRYALDTLLRVLKDQSLREYHRQAIESLMFLVKGLRQESVTYLDEFMPPILDLLETRSRLREFLFPQLCELVSIVQLHIQRYLPRILDMTEGMWEGNTLLHLLPLMETIAAVLSEEIRVWLPRIMPNLLNVFDVDKTPEKKYIQASYKVFIALGFVVEEYLHLIIPKLILLIDSGPSPIVEETIIMIGDLSKNADIKDYSSSIIRILITALKNYSNLSEVTLDSLCLVISSIKEEYLIWVPVVGKILEECNVQYDVYDAIVENIARMNFDVQLPVKYERKRASSVSVGRKDIGMGYKVKLNVGLLSLQVSDMFTENEWIQWMQQFSASLMRYSPSRSLQSCTALVLDSYPVSRELFNPAFLSWWEDLDDEERENLLEKLNEVISNKSTPPEVLGNILDLAEFMDQNDQPLTFEKRTLSKIAQECGAFAKALYYKEIEFIENPDSFEVAESLISLYTSLGLTYASHGIVQFMKRRNADFEIPEQWNDIMGNWSAALSTYTKRYSNDSSDTEALMGMFECVCNLSKWEDLLDLTEQVWDLSHPNIKDIAKYGLRAACHLKNWDLASTYLEPISENTIRGSFYRALLALENGNIPQALNSVNAVRGMLDSELRVVIGESYQRAYSNLILLQQLSEMEEIKIYKSAGPETKEHIKRIWSNRLEGCQQDIDIWRRVLQVRSVAIDPIMDTNIYIKYSRLCRKSGQFELMNKTLQSLKGANADCEVFYNEIKGEWDQNRYQLAFEKLRRLHDDLDNMNCPNKLRSRINHKLGLWQMTLTDSNELTPSSNDIMEYFHEATRYDPTWYKAWRSWALINVNAIEENGLEESHITAAIKGFKLSIKNQNERNHIEDTLNLLTLWFKYSNFPSTMYSIESCLEDLPVETWLEVIPQIIARIHSVVPALQTLLIQLLTEVGRVHPQSLVYTLAVATQSQSKTRANIIRSIKHQLSSHSKELVDQSQMVATELVRTAIFWSEKWHTSISTFMAPCRFDASKCSYISKLATEFKPLHDMMREGAQTARDSLFLKHFGKLLVQAEDFTRRYKHSKNISDLKEAWDLYFAIYRRLTKYLKGQKVVELKHCSPILLEHGNNLELAVPGTYKAHKDPIRIVRFSTSIAIMKSKHRPRRISVFGDNGHDYNFLLKGNEDLRLDERVMQLFSLVNGLLKKEVSTRKDYLSIERYSITPLSPNSGLIGWVLHSDTFHQLITDHRRANNEIMDKEYQLMKGIDPNYDELPIDQKIKIWDVMVRSTPGDDIAKVMRLKSPNSEIWVDRRSTFTKSLAVMSMVGYILGLGDRHPSNLMLDRHTGKVIHIDFGDCFEVAMQREFCPERVPFRLTRMLVNALEPCGIIDGTFRIISENTMSVLRQNSNSVLAVLESFAHDPLFNWRFNNDNQEDNNPYEEDFFHEAEIPEELNRKAVAIISRIRNKLKGKDFDEDITLTVSEQVSNLISEATSVENLNRSFVGWCPFW
eukprot:TRINITY_DN3829_c0_g1_i1.p1 TRINITY_DN3829_c0_g1~~TRINITY_DN3829_c0_g1_i1.p1  ORF type:complete len:2225 (-),score=435.29 TRINITY_DN3829_c0_g1_i1:13-6618(-)